MNKKKRQSDSLASRNYKKQTKRHFIKTQKNKEGKKGNGRHGLQKKFSYYHIRRTHIYNLENPKPKKDGKKRGPARDRGAFFYEAD